MFKYDATTSLPLLAMQKLLAVLITPPLTFTSTLLNIPIPKPPLEQLMVVCSPSIVAIIEDVGFTLDKIIAPPEVPVAVVLNVPPFICKILGSTKLSALNIQEEPV
ncbi:MAG: hypothetical protein MJZ65_02795 [Paludibacteraceae bacterium]|nr:hypothetical protein [Paludibacteraceae bacterium]